jgi:hypothetical protein
LNSTNRCCPPFSTGGAHKKLDTISRCLIFGVVFFTSAMAREECSVLLAFKDGLGLRLRLYVKARRRERDIFADEALEI